MKPGRSGAAIGSLPSEVANDFDQLHQRYGIEEVKAAEPIRALRCDCQLGDAQR